MLFADDGGPRLVRGGETGPLPQILSISLGQRVARGIESWLSVACALLLYADAGEFHIEGRIRGPMREVATSMEYVVVAGRTGDSVVDKDLRFHRKS